MAFIFVQYWGPLPTRNDFMGDLPSRPQPGGSSTNTQQGSSTSTSSPGLYENDPSKLQYGAPSPSHLAQASQLHQHPQGQQVRPDAFAMNSLGPSLPDISYQNYNLPGQRFASNSPASAMLYHVPNMPQFAGQASMTQPGNAPYNIQFQPQYQNVYAPHYSSSHPQSPHQLPIGSQGTTQIYQGQGYIGHPQMQQPVSPYFVQPNQYGPGQLYSGSSSGAQYGRGNFQAATPQQRNDFSGFSSNSGQPGRSANITASSAQSSVVRGPPRKPRQSGHAIWIGNLPPQTELMSLVYHVCKESIGLESLFLISKSNCAFANYKDEAACAVAQSKIHDSRFQTVRLVSRLRRNSVGTVSGLVVPTGPAALNPPQLSTPRTPSPEHAAKSKNYVEIVEDHKEDDGGDTALPKDKYFIVKSLTVEDLELSVRNGIWATQSHNEEALNNAYQAVDNVFLIFSANKSGEYFGYARMVSPINDDPAAAIEFAPKAQAVEDPELPKAIPTPATEYAPKGRIIDDSARGTIFWEAERDELDEADDEDEVRSSKSDPEGEASSKAWGKPFKVEWITTTRLPFYRTRGLRNPWNSNREVKIARDGTELETSIGRRLVSLFHRLPSPVAQSMPTMPGMPPQPMGGFPQMRQYS